MLDGGFDDPRFDIFVLFSRHSGLARPFISSEAVAENHIGLLPFLFPRIVSLQGLSSHPYPLSPLRFCSMCDFVGFQLALEGDSTELRRIVSDIATQVNQTVMSLLMRKFDAPSHIRAIKKFILLGQGDFHQILMDSLFSMLSRPAAAISKHSLQSRVDAAVRGSKAQLEKEDVLRRISVRILDSRESKSHSAALCSQSTADPLCPSRCVGLGNFCS